jgi:ATP-dependent RNA helicase DDX3X
MSAQGWGLTAPSAPDAADASIGETGGAFGASELREALLVDGNDQISDSKKPKIPEGWAQATPYDYEALGNKGNHDWDGNAKVYEWDGEEGDVGPEHPALEIELFGEPGNRVKQGIDFSK